MLIKIKQSLLLQVVLAVFALVALQTYSAISFTQSSVFDLVSDLRLKLTDSSRALDQALMQAQQESQQALSAMAQDTHSALSASLKTQLNEKQQSMTVLLDNNARLNADGMATMLASIAPQAIIDRANAYIKSRAAAASSSPSSSATEVNQ